MVVEVQISIATADAGTLTDEELHLYPANDEGKVNRMHTTSTLRSRSRVTGWGSRRGRGHYCRSWSTEGPRGAWVPERGFPGLGESTIFALCRVARLG